jgi:glycine dehydrogenase subunit 1
MSYGGPYLGIFACRAELVRQMPGRIAGETRDAKGRRGFVNTLQTREQHIRREKATSNICTNEAIAAITAAVYMALLGPSGMRAAARTGVARAHALAQRLSAIPGCSVAMTGPFLDRFALRTPVGGFALRWRLLREANIVAGDATLDHYPGRDDLILQCTETTSEAHMDALVSALGAAVAGEREKVGVK